MADEGGDWTGQGAHEPDHDPFACGLITVLLVLGVGVWLGIVYLLTRSW